MMLKKYSNQIFDLVKDLGFEPSDFKLFDLANHPKGDAVSVMYKKSRMGFLFINKKASYDDFKQQYTVFQKQLPTSAIMPQKSWLSFGEVIISFKTWLKQDLTHFINELEEVDYWAVANKNVENLKLEAIDFDDDSTFSTEEEEQIKLGLEEAKVLLQANFNLTDTQLAIVYLRLNYLVEAVERNIKSDWKSIAISTILGMNLILSLEKEKSQEIWKLFKKVFEYIPSSPVS